MSSRSQIGSADSAATIVQRSSNIITQDKPAIHTGNEPHITLNRLVIDKKTGKVLRNACAEFYLEGRSLDGRTRSMWGLLIKTVEGEAVLGLAYSAAVVSGVDNIPDEWPDDVREMVAEMVEIRNDCALPVIPLSARTAADVRCIQSLIDELQDMKPGRLLASFRDKNGETVTEWDDLKFHHRAKDLPQSRIKYCFPSLEVAAIKLCAGRYLEHNWQETVVASLSGGTNVSFVVIGVGLVLAFVNYRDRKQIKKKAQLDDHMTIQILFEVDDSEEESEDGYPRKKAIKVKGKLASNRIGLESDFSVLLEKPSKAVFKCASKYGDQPVFIPAQVKIEENSRLAELEVKAVHTLCQEGDNPHAEFQEMLLAEDAARAEPRNFLVEDVGCSPHEISSITQNVIGKLVRAGKPPNAEQADILRNAGVVRAKFKCILGPPGTGKTTTIAALTEIYVRCPGVGILLCAPSNGNTGRIYDAVSAWMARSRHELDRDTQKPQRVYRVHLEEEYLLKNHDHLGNASGRKLDEAQAARFMEAAGKIAADAAWYERQGEADRRKAMSDATTGVTHAVVDAVVNANRQQAFTASNRVGGSMATLKAGLMSLKYTPFHKWSKNSKLTFIDAWRTLARALVGRKRIVVCTAGNTVSSLMAEAFSECKHVVIILDEASLCTDPALWNVVANLLKPERLESEFSGRTPVRAVVIVGDHHQGKAVIKSEIVS
jgi:hypothetical protein